MTEVKVKMIKHRSDTPPDSPYSDVEIEEMYQAELISANKISANRISATGQPDPTRPVP